MAEFRIEKSDGFTVMSNHHLRNPDLSLKAKGLLSQMLSLPDNWDYTLAGLAAINQEGKDAIRAAIVELEKAGYVERRQTRDENGKLAGNEYVIRECPVQPLSENPTTDNPSTEKPSAENPTQINKDKSNKDLLEKKNKKEKATRRKPKGTPLPRDEQEAQLRIWYDSICDGVPLGQADQLWKDLMLFLDHRAGLKIEYTDKSGITALCNKLMRLSGGSIAMMCAMLEEAVERGWRSIYPMKDRIDSGGGVGLPDPPGEAKRWL